MFKPKWSELTTHTERTTVMVLIIYGYLLLAGILLIILFFIGFYFGYKNYIKSDLDLVANTN